MQKLSNGLVLKPDILIYYTNKYYEQSSKEAIIQAAIKCGGRSIYLEGKGAKVAAVGVGLDIFSQWNMIKCRWQEQKWCAVLSMGSGSRAVPIKLAGDNMDFAISEYIKDKYQLIIGDRTAEAIKMNLGSAIEVENESDMIVKGRDMTFGLPKTVTIYTNEFVIA